jgi:hypothetical protein
MNHPRIKLVWWLIAVAVASFLVSLVLTNNISLSSEQSSVSFDHGRRVLLPGGFGHNIYPLVPQAAARLRGNAYTGIGKEFDQKELPQNLPLEWEDKFFGIFEDEDASTDEVDRRLIELATGKAAGEPRVQLECLRHLAYSLPDDADQSILFVATHGKIPLHIRVHFLELALSMRPMELAAKIFSNVSQHDEYELAALARRYAEQMTEGH